MKRTHITLFLGVVLMLCTCFASPALSQELQATTTSPEARKIFDQGRQELANLNLDAARVDWHKALELDPDFTMAHAFLAFIAQNPAEQASELSKTEAGKAHVTAGEQVVVGWLENSVQGKILPAIQSLNDALELFPTDKPFVWGAGLWLQYRGACDLAIPIYERVLQQDKSYQPAWRNLGECYINTRNWSKAVAAMKDYAAQFPHQAKPEISYGQALIKAGKYDKATAHCKAGLEIDPKSYDGWYCLAQVDALKGDEKRARTEYEKSIEFASTTRHWAVSSEIGATYVRERDYKGADQVFNDIVSRAQAARARQMEAEAYRSMALYREDPAAALQFLDKADAAIQGRVDLIQAASVRARILETRTLLALRLQNTDMAEGAVKQLQDLMKIHLPLVEQCYSGAEGALLMAQGKYEEAISYLTADPDNAFSMQNLIVAYQKSGAKKLAREAQQNLAENHSVSLEQVVVNLDQHKQKIQVASN